MKVPKCHPQFFSYAALITLAGIWVAVRVLSVPGEGHLLFGDTGDGLFNLWIFEHIRLSLPGGWAALSDGRILHPEVNTFWYSDNLLSLSPPYLLLRGFKVSVLTAGFWTHVFWTLTAVGVTGWLFSEVRKGVNTAVPTLGTSGGMLTPLLGLTWLWIPAQVEGWKHFQNQAWVFGMLLIIMLLRYLRQYQRRWLIGAAACECLLMASAPYFAVMGLWLLLAAGLMLLADSTFPWKQCLTRQLPWTLPFAAVFLYIAFPYMLSGHPDYDHVELLRRSWNVSDGLGPAGQGRPEGFPGISWWVGVSVPILWALFIFIRRKKWAVLKDKWLWGLAGIGLLTCIKAKEVYPVTAWLRLGVLLALVIWMVMRIRPRSHPACRMLIFLLLSGVCFAGTAMGPGTFFGEGHPDSSVWGIGAMILPGFEGMRDLIRFTPSAALILLCFSFGLWWRWGPGNDWRQWTLPALVSLGLCVEASRMPLEMMRLDPERLTLQEDQQAFFNTRPGVNLLVIPAAPFHRNPETMLRWQPVKTLRLINGYTGRNFSAFEAVIRAENHHGRASKAQVEAAKEAEADWICLRKDWVPDDAETALRQGWPVVYEDEELLVVELGFGPDL